MKRISFVQWCCVAAATLGATAGWAQGNGLRVDDAGVSLGNRLAARVSLGPQAVWSGHSGIVLGDYYFERTRLGSMDVSGGFRATSGVLLGQRPAVLGAPAAVQNTVNDAWLATPYVGVGWSSTSARRGWGFTADLGLAARGSQGGLRVGNGQTLDDLLRDLRLMPTLQVGVSYSF
jgi:hypothetical protein